MKSIKQDFYDLMKIKEGYIKHNSIDIMKLENIIDIVLNDNNMEKATKNTIYYYLRQDYLKAIWKREIFKRGVKYGN